MKGQSAIEYLMTYGWMLLVVAIIGGAIFSTVNGRCIEDTTGFSGSDISVDGLAVVADDDGSDYLGIEIRNTANEPVKIGPDDIILRDQGSDITLKNGWWSDVRTINVGESETFDVNAYNTAGASDGCTELDVKIEYNLSEGIKNQVDEGQATLQADIN